MKPCLKHSPPTTPNLSQLSSPSGSRSSTPPPTPSTARKCVSFCAEEKGLEEVWEADDWDRSPTPMTPKLSYQDVLELKQLQLSLPRAPANPSYQRPFTTSAPRSTFGPPISRFAAAPSLTPSKWKNRDDSRGHVDSEILPYLDAVPIQLLPLLDTPPSTPEYTPDSATPSCSRSHSEPDTPTPTDLDTSSQSPSASTPAFASTPIEVSASPASTSSPVTAPTIIIQSPVSPSPIASPPLSPPPPPPPPPSSSHDITPKSSPRRTPHFHFLPLLPVQDTPPPPPEPLVQKPVEPKRKFNMSFVPLLPPSEPELAPVPTPSPPEPTTLEPTLPVEDALASLSLHPTTTETPSESETEDTADDHSHHLRRRLMTIPLYTASASPSSSTTPSLSSASDTDADADDLDTGSSVPSSPGERDFSSVSGGGGGGGASHSHTVPGEVNPYFPALPSPGQGLVRSPHTPRQEASGVDACVIARPGQTPPLSSLYPHPQADVSQVKRKGGEQEQEGMGMTTK
ncbi:hypothetical protein EIP91_003325, partial [Steccherinum ochraceum]